MVLLLSQNFIRRGETTDSKTMVPLIPVRVEKPVTGVLLELAIRFMMVHLCGGGDDWQGNGCEVGTWCSCRQGITGRSLANCQEEAPPAGRFRESVRQIQRT